MVSRKPGEWKSPLTASDIAKAGVSAAWPAIVGDDVWWVESRPEEGGRRVVVSKKLGDLIPAPFSASHSVHEYGGRSYLGISNNGSYTLYFSNKSDQRVYKVGFAPRASAKRSASAPYLSINSSGSITLPFDLDIFFPCLSLTNP